MGGQNRHEALLTPGLKTENRRRAFIQPPTVVMFPHARGPLEAPLDDCAVVYAKLQVLSFSMKECICLPLEVWQESWPNFKGITKGKWSHHQSLGFSNVWLVTCF